MILISPQPSDAFPGGQDTREEEEEEEEESHGTGSWSLSKQKLSSQQPVPTMAEGEVFKKHSAARPDLVYPRYLWNYHHSMPFSCPANANIRPREPHFTHLHVAPIAALHTKTNAWTGIKIFCCVVVHLQRLRQPGEGTWVPWLRS